MIVSSNSNLGDTPPDGESPRQDSKLPKYCGGRLMVGHLAHNQNTEFESHVRNQMPQ